MRPGARNLITDVEGLRVGNAADHRLKTGSTVVTGDGPFVAAVHVMGGAPGSRETDLLAPGATVEVVDALVLSGGSAWGLAAAEGVMAGLHAAGRGFAVGPHRIPIVPAAIVFDLAAGGAPWEANPYPALGRAAFEAASRDFALGTAGAGTGATTSTLKGGLGSASAVLASGATVGALVVANPVGQVTATGARAFLAGPWEEGDEFGGLGPAPRAGDPAPTKAEARVATVIAVVATDLALTRAEATRLAIQAHDGIARAVQPAHTFLDGDLVFAAATGARGPATDADRLALGHAAATCLARAIARAVYLATPRPRRPAAVLVGAALTPRSANHHPRPIQPRRGSLSRQAVSLDPARLPFFLFENTPGEPARFAGGGGAPSPARGPPAVDPRRGAG